MTALRQRTSPSSPPVRLALWIEDLRALDAPAAALAPVAEGLLADPRRKSLLQGQWLGHALHPLLTFLPLGSWTSAVVLDLTGRDRAAAQHLVGVGLLTALPAALTGLAEWGDAGQRDRRTGIAHAAANSVALLFFFRSWRARRRGEHERGARLALVGAAASGAGGFLGGHLTEARKVSSRHPRFERD